MFPKKSKRKFKQLLKKSVKRYRRSFFARKITTSTYFSLSLLFIGLSLLFLPYAIKLKSSAENALYLRNSVITNGFDNGPIYSSFDGITIHTIVGDYPVRIIIPALKVDLEVKPSRLINGYWEIHTDSANFGIGSALPDENGNTVIFAHAKNNQFGPLKKAKKDYEVSIQTKNGQWHTYKIVEKKEVKPHEVEVVGPTDVKTLTLYTCSGFADSKRLVVVAK